MKNIIPKLIFLSFLCFLFVGCSPMKGNIGNMATYSFSFVEPEWLRDGEPIEFEKELWSPEDNFEVLLDSEVYLLGEYREIQFFAERIDVRPYNRLYTKFGQNKFRTFSKKMADN